MVAIAIGSGLVLFSRPFDGGIVCAMLVVSLAPALMRCLLPRMSRWNIAATANPIASYWFLLRMAIPAFGIVLVLMGLLMANNELVTGHWYLLPYQLHEKQYGVAPLFIWGTPNEPTVGHRFVELSTYHRVCSLQSWSDARSVEGYMFQLLNRSRSILVHW